MLRLFQGLFATGIVASVAWGWATDVGLERTMLAAAGSALLVLTGFLLLVLGWMTTKGRHLAPRPGPVGEWIVATVWFLLLPLAAALLGAVAWAAARAPDWTSAGPSWVATALWTAAGCGAGLVLGWPTVQRLARRGEVRARWAGADLPERQGSA